MAVGVIILRLVCAAPGALLLSLPAFTADIGAVLPSSNVAAASPMLLPTSESAMRRACYLLF